MRMKFEEKTFVSSNQAKPLNPKLKRGIHMRCGRMRIDRITNVIMLMLQKMQMNPLFTLHILCKSSLVPPVFPMPILYTVHMYHPDMSVPMHRPDMPDTPMTYNGFMKRTARHLMSNRSSYR
jgi:hypothetical protein